MRSCQPLFILSLLLLAFCQISAGQVSPEDHKKHHPKKTPEQGGEKQPGGMMGGAGMGDMMKAMGVPPKKELYPSLMSIRHIDASRRAELNADAHKRMQEGALLLSRGLSTLTRLAPSDDFRGMEEAVGIMKEGISEFESGLATHRALAEGKVPSNVALKWFRHEMNLDSAARPVPKGFLGLGWFHLSVMVILVLFVLAFVGLHFFKMKRIGRLLDEADDGLSGGDPEAAVSKVGLQKWPSEIEVSGIFPETTDITTFRFVDPMDPARSFHYKAGQFLTLTPTINGKMVRRCYTLSSSPARHYLELTVKREKAGLVSQYLHDELKLGSRIAAQPPAGSFTFDKSKNSAVVLMSGGVGATPMISIVRDLAENCWAGQIYYVHCCKTIEDIVFNDELNYLAARHPNLKLVITLTAETRKKWKGLKGRFSAELLAREVPRIADLPVHVCGPTAMMDSVTSILGDLNVPKTAIHLEAFGAATPVVHAVEEMKPNNTDGHRVEFMASKKIGAAHDSKSVLDVAEEVGVEIENSCRTGICGACKVVLTSGSVKMEVEDALTDDDRQSGVVLACQALPETGVQIDA